MCYIGEGLLQDEGGGLYRHLQVGGENGVGDAR